MAERGERFVPCTREIEIAQNIVYRPVRMWHTGVYAGENIASVHGDGSGCVQQINGQAMTNVPATVTHRAYWNRSRPDVCVSAFLSYPGAMGACEEYFWEAMLMNGAPDAENEQEAEDAASDPIRFTGTNAESEMETFIVRLLRDAPLIETAREVLMLPEGT
jgi:hypothetical protein